VAPGALRVLQDLLRDDMAGDPISGLRWTHRSLRKLCKALRCGHRISLSAPTLTRLLRQLRFSLRTCRKKKAGLSDPERDRQFKYLIRQRRLFLAQKWPVISVDTKKKEQIADFKNPGRCWRDRERTVLDHDYPKWASGQAIPLGIYDLAHNDGYVAVGISCETPTFEVRTIRRWWFQVGRERYPNAPRLLIQADSGGANDYRKWEWKLALQDLADEIGIPITVTHYPPGASKWNPIEHRMFSLLSANWAGEPLSSYETVLKHIRTTRSRTGFRCRAVLDCRRYIPLRRATNEQKKSVRIKRHRVLPNWNYTIVPHD
jgi:hypothetical protein